MEFLLVPESLVLFEIKVVHTGLSDLIVRWASLDDLTLIVVIQGKIEVTHTCLTIQSCTYIGEKRKEKSHVDGIPDLGNVGNRCNRYNVAQQEGYGHQIADQWTRASVQNITDPKNWLENWVANSKENPKVEGGIEIRGIGDVRLHFLYRVKELGVASGM